MNKLIQSIEQDHNKTARTVNGAVSNHSSLSATVDLFSKIGAVRGKEAMAWQLFSNAFSQDPVKAMKILFYSRDIRGGQGERQTFRSIIKKLTEINPDVVTKNLHLFSEYGRWDDLKCLFGTRLEKQAIEIWCNQLNKDWNSDKPSLAAKWVFSSNASSKETKANARKIIKHLGISEKEYRQGLSRIRAKIGKNGILETQMSEKDWANIDYSSVPSVAGIKFRKAFSRNDADRYVGYLDSVKKGEAKMNTSALFPYDLVGKYLGGSGWGRTITNLDQTIETAWENLPNYLEGNEHNGLVICDTSGSMYGGRNGGVSPINVALSLTMYIAERNKGAFKDWFMTFSETPQLQKIKGMTLRDKVTNLIKADWAMNTNFQSAFDTILNNAVQNNVPHEDMPSVVYVVSDMQYDSASRQKTNFEVLRDKYHAAGYELPKLVFWNVNAGSDQPVTIHDWNTVLVSGCNPNIFNQILSGSNPEEVMNKVIESERYAPITV